MLCRGRAPAGASVQAYASHFAADEDQQGNLQRRVPRDWGEGDDGLERRRLKG